MNTFEQFGEISGNAFMEDDALINVGSLSFPFEEQKIRMMAPDMRAEHVQKLEVAIADFEKTHSGSLSGLAEFKKFLEEEKGRFLRKAA